MSKLDGRSRPAHMAGAPKRAPRQERQSRRAPREELQDNYYYEEPRRGQYDDFQDLSSYSEPQMRKSDLKELKRQQKRKKGGKKAAVVLSVLLVLVLLVGGAAYYVFGYVLKDLTVDSTFTKDPQQLGITAGSVDDLDIPTSLDSSIKNIAMFGVDDRSDSFEGRSDVIMILTIDNKHKKIKMTSILRDSCVYIDEWGYNKINSAYAWGGPDLAVRTLNSNFKTEGFQPYITEYVTVNIARMADIIDAVGGVEIELTGEECRQVNINLWNLFVDVGKEKQRARENGDISEHHYATIQQSDYIPDAEGSISHYSDQYLDGTYTLNGNQAVAYGRIRYIDSDDVRAVRQQTVFKALIEKIKGKSKLEYPELIRKIMPMCKTSLDFNDIVGMLPIIFTDFTIETLNIPGEVEEPTGAYLEGPSWIYLYDWDAAAQHMSQFIYETDSPYFGQEIYPVYPSEVPTVEVGSDYDVPSNDYDDWNSSDSDGDTSIDGDDSRSSDDGNESGGEDLTSSEGGDVGGGENSGSTDPPPEDGGETDDTAAENDSDDGTMTM